MYKTISVLVALALVAVVAPGMQADEETNREVNIAWMLERRADIDLDESVTIYRGGEATDMTAREAIELFGDRSERLNLPAVMAGADHSPSNVLAGDVWILEDSFTPGECPSANVLGASPVPAMPLDPQLYIYGGPGFVIHDEAHSDVAARPGLTFGIHIGWTTKATGDHTGQQSSVAGISDLFCIDWGIFGTTWFPFANGVAYTG